MPVTHASKNNERPTTYIGLDNRADRHGERGRHDIRYCDTVFPCSEIRRDLAPQLGFNKGKQNAYQSINQKRLRLRHYLSDLR